MVFPSFFNAEINSSLYEIVVTVDGNCFNVCLMFLILHIKKMANLCFVTHFPVEVDRFYLYWNSKV